MSGRAPLNQALSSLKIALEAAPGLRSVAFFGSAREKRVWAHSDIDILAIVDRDGKHMKSRMLLWEGWEVELQALSPVSFAETACVNRGSAFARALRSADVWFDRGGELTAACRLLSGMDLNARDLAVFRSTARLVESLHDAERHLHFGRHRKGRLALAGALEHAHALRVAEAGALPLREPWAHPSPERDQLDALLAGADPAPTLHAAWATVRDGLGRRCAVLLQQVHRHAPLAVGVAEALPLFIGIPLSDRLMTELVDAGFVRRTFATEELTGLPALRFERTKKGRPDVFPAGDPSLHLDREAIEQALAERAVPPRDHGRVALLVRRILGGARELPSRVLLCREDGVVGDDWQRRRKHKPLEQVAVMERAVAEILANGQPIEILGDNLFVELDLSDANLPAGSRLRVGTAIVEVSTETHDGCSKLAPRVGQAAFRALADKATRAQNRRGLYWKVVENGEVSVGDAIVVLERPVHP